MVAMGSDILSNFRAAKPNAIEDHQARIFILHSAD
jgi:hypothetical protein